MFREVSISTLKELEQNIIKEIFGERILKLLEINNMRTEMNPSIEELDQENVPDSKTNRRERQENWRTSPEGLISDKQEFQREKTRYM